MSDQSVLNTCSSCFTEATSGGLLFTSISSMLAISISSLFTSTSTMLEILIASMLDMDVNKRPPDVASVKHELHVLSTLWSDIRKSFWRPKLGYTQKMRN